MKIIFAGTPEFARIALNGILQAAPQYNFEVSLVLTQPDRPAGRGMKLQASAVKQLALEHHLFIAQPAKMAQLDEAATALIRAADIMVVVAYGLILPQRILDLPRLGCINIHASLLPRWRGAAPIHRAIEAGDDETGVCIMQMEAGLDTGPVLLRQALPIEPRDTTATLHDKLAQLGAQLCVQALTQFDTLRPQSQRVEGVSYAHKISKAEAMIDWQQSAEAIERKIRAFNPFPACSSALSGEVVKIWGAKPVARATRNTESTPAGQIMAIDHEGIYVACGEGVLCLTELQRAGGKRLAAAEFCKGFAVEVGAVLE
jgi:methionyl-tRNA formyltransferase